MGDASDALLVLYAAVAIKSPTAPPCMLAEHATACGNFRKVAKSLVDKLPHVNDRRTFTLQQYAFNVLVKDRFVFLAIVCLNTRTSPACRHDLAVANSFARAHVHEQGGLGTSLSQGLSWKSALRVTECVRAG
eukprot:Tamp_11114.p3 GENE.Tamp_11114~~Tamp_11114.p3  ORF type:complete len:133 (+),score=14.79 Tamp_11114:227-625(+)